jgi:flavocytochrome c
VLERGGRVLVLDKNAFMGGNSTKATSGINGAGTRQQAALGIKDSPEVFLRDTAISAAKGQKDAPAYPLAKVLTFGSGPAVEWLIDSFGLDLSLVSRLGGHSEPRTHRGKERFPGMTITYALMEKLEEIAEKDPKRARVIVNARVTKLITDSNGAITGVEYTNQKDGKVHREEGVVIIATGGYAADYSETSILKKVRPELLKFPTTNGEHCTGDGIKFAEAIGAGTVDLEWVQVHPTGLVHPEDPDAKVKFLAAEALRGVGGLMLDGKGKRFVNELATRDFVSGEMWKNQGPFRLVLNSKSSKEIEWHCKHYQGRGLMKYFKTGREVAADIGVSADTLERVFNDYNSAARNNNDPFGKKFFQNAPYEMNDYYYVAIITPVVHYCMGGLHISPLAEVLTPKEQGGKVIPGLWATGEVCGGVHGKNRLGGSSLLDCVVYGRVSGDSATKYLLQQLSSDSSKANRRLGALSNHIGLNVSVDPSKKGVSIQLSWDDQKDQSGTTAQGTTSASTGTGSAANPEVAEMAAKPAAAAAAPVAPKTFTLADVAKHNKETDCWVAVNGQVLDVTHFLKDHPGGKQAILLFAGKDATAEFNMLHKPEVVQKYAANCILGTLAA